MLDTVVRNADATHAFAGLKVLRAEALSHERFYPQGMLGQVWIIFGCHNCGWGGTLLASSEWKPGHC